jgi:hypothetical protein
VQIAILNKNIMQEPSEVKATDIYLVVIGGLLVLFGSLQYLILLVLILPFLLLFALKKNTLEQYKKFYNLHENKIILSVVYFYAVFFLFYWGYFRAAFSNNLVYIEGIEKYIAPSFWDIFIPNQYLGSFWSLINPSPFSIERVITIGTIEILLLLWALIVSRRTRSRLFGVFLIVAYILLSFGLIKIPFYPEGGRITILLSLYTATMFLLESDKLKRQEFLGLIFSLIVIEKLFFNLQQVYPPYSQILRDKIRPLRGEAVLNVPLSKYDTYRSALPVFYQKKILDGYFHYTAANQRAERLLEDDLFARFICNLEREDIPSYTYGADDSARFYDALRRMDIGSIVLFKDEEVGKFYWDDCSNVRDWWYWINPSTLVLNKDTDEIIRHSFEIPEDNPHTIARIHFERNGRFVMDGAFVTPRGLQDWSVVLPSGEVVRPKIEEVEGGYRFSFNPPLEQEVSAGQSLLIISGNEVDFTRYLSVFYLFEEDKSSLERKRVMFEKIYDDREIEIYRLNY